MRSVWVGNFETQEGLSGCWGAEMNGPVIWTSWRHVSACGQFEVSEAGRAIQLTLFCPQYERRGSREAQ